MRKPERNYAFVDSNNIYLGVRSLGWKIDFVRFRKYLKEKYGVDRAFLFMGYVPNNESLYRKLSNAGFELVFKEVSRGEGGKIKGNCDAELVLAAMVHVNNYDRAVIVSGDGDFACLARHLISVRKFEKIVAPSRSSCSALLHKLPSGSLDFVENHRAWLEKLSPNESSVSSQ